MEILYKPSFVRDYKHLPDDVKNEAKKAIELFKDRSNHDSLKVHKLKGKLKDCYSFSVTFAHRIVFQFESKDTVVLLAIGDHDVYR